MVHMVEAPCDSETSPETEERLGSVRPPAAGQPTPIRGSPRLPAGRRVTPRGRSPLRLHPLDADLAGPRLPGRQDHAVRRPGQTRPQERAAQGRRPRPGHRAAPRGPVGLRDQPAAGRRGHPAQPHRDRADPGRGRLRAAAAPPRARDQHQPGHHRARHNTAPGQGHRLRPLPRHGHHTAGRAAADRPGPGRPRPAHPCPQGRLPRHPGHPRRVLAAVPAGPQADRHPARQPRRRPTRRPRQRPVRRAGDPGWRSCRKSPPSPSTPTACPTTTSATSWPPWTPS